LRHASRSLLLLTGHPRCRHAAGAEETTEEFGDLCIVGHLWGLPTLLGYFRLAADLCFNTDHPRTDLFHQMGEIGQADDELRSRRRRLLRRLCCRRGKPTDADADGQRKGC
jgi:hypothetical protein